MMPLMLVSMLDIILCGDHCQREAQYPIFHMFATLQVSCYQNCNSVTAQPGKKLFGEHKKYD